MVGLGSGVREPRITHDDRCTLLLRLNDSLRVWIEVVARLQVRRDQEDDLGVGVVSRRTVVTHPRLVANTCVRRADVRMAVVAVDAPCLQHSVRVVRLAGATNVIHDLVVAFFFDRLADASADLFERLIPANALPLATAPFSYPLHRVHNPLGVIDLVQRRWSLGAVAATARGVLGVALDLVDLARFLVEVTEQTATSFAVEARGRYQRVLLLDLRRPRLGVELGPVMPLLERRVVREIGHAAFLAVFFAITHSLRSVHSADWWLVLFFAIVASIAHRYVMTAALTGRPGRRSLRRRTFQSGREPLQSPGLWRYCYWSLTRRSL